MCVLLAAYISRVEPSNVHVYGFLKKPNRRNKNNERREKKTPNHTHHLNNNRQMCWVCLCAWVSAYFRSRHTYRCLDSLTIIMNVVFFFGRFCRGFFSSVHFVPIAFDFKCYCVRSVWVCRGVVFCLWKFWFAREWARVGDDATCALLKQLHRAVLCNCAHSQRLAEQVNR